MEMPDRVEPCSSGGIAMTLELTPEQDQIIIDALRDRIGKLYDMSEQYKGTGFTGCQKDCLNEKKKVQELLKRIQG